MGRLRKLLGISLSALLVAAWMGLLAAPGFAQEAQGEEVFTRVCSSCHGADGAGVPGAFPPLVDNPNLQDAAYVEEVIRNGLAGEIVVNGVTYDSQMPGFGTQLSEPEIGALLDYVQETFAAEAPAEPGEPAEAPAPADEDEGFPWNLIMLGSAQTVVIVGLIFLFGSPALKGELSWWTAYARGLVIFLFFVLATVWLPSWVVGQGPVAGASRWIADVVGTVVWLVPLAIGIVALRWLQKMERI